MNVEFSKKFDRQTKKIREKWLKDKIGEAIQSVIDAKTIGDIPHLKKLTGFKHHYRIKIGDYRIGIYSESDTVGFEAFAHRKDIYRIFPSF